MLTVLSGVALAGAEGRTSGIQGGEALVGDYYPLLMRHSQAIRDCPHAVGRTKQGYGTARLCL